MISIHLFQESFYSLRILPWQFGLRQSGASKYRAVNLEGGGKNPDKYNKPDNPPNEVHSPKIISVVHNVDFY